jgi:tetratricopeptide (TPR) repeat protein
MTHRVFILLLAAVVLLACDVARSAEQDHNPRLDRAGDTARGAKPLEAVKVCEEVIAAPDSSEDQKLRALQIIVDAQLKAGKPSDAAQTAARMATVAPNAKGKRASAFAQADILRVQGKHADAVAKVAELLTTISDPAAKQEAQLRIAELWSNAQKWDDAHAAAAKVLEIAHGDDNYTLRALNLMADAGSRQNNPDRAIDALTRMLDPGFSDRRDDNYRRDVRRRLLGAYQSAKKYAEARALCAQAEKAEREERDRQFWVVALGDTFADEGKYDEALAAYERVFLEVNKASDLWALAQRKIADAYFKSGKPLDAVKAMHVVIDITTDLNQLGDAVKQTAEMLKAIDNSLARANQLIQFQRFGPAGEDGKGGLTSPLAEIGYLQNPQRDKALAAMREKAGDSAAAMRLRAYSYMYCGQPKQALRCFLDAFGRCSMEEFQRYGDELVLVGVRALRGHPVGLEEFYTFVNYGPPGPDGKSGTGDDLQDPFAPLMK